jgi:hypothetical protein
MEIGSSKQVRWVASAKYHERWKNKFRDALRVRNQSNAHQSTYAKAQNKYAHFDVWFAIDGSNVLQ